MEENNNTTSGIERAEEISGIIGNIGGFLAGRTNNPLIEAGWETLSGHSGLATSLGDLLNKLHNGTATSDDVADVLQSIAGIMAGVGVMANVANPRTLALLGLVGTARELLGYIEDHPELAQEMKGIFNNPANLQEWFDIWGFFNNKFQISSNTNELFFKSKNNNMNYTSPLVLDLDGDGIETFGISDETHVVFDHDGDGIKNGTAWVGSDDGLLVLDRDGNGFIDSGSELFGVYTEVDGTRAGNGFIALIDQDSNDDSVFDAADANFSNVRVWREKVNCEARETTLEYKNQDSHYPDQHDA